MKIACWQYLKNLKEPHFFYKVNDDVSFHCNLLSEVGQPYQAWFKMIMESKKYKIIPKETETDYFDTLTTLKND